MYNNIPLKQLFKGFENPNFGQKLSQILAQLWDVKKGSFRCPNGLILIHNKGTWVTKVPYQFRVKTRSKR